MELWVRSQNKENLIPIKNPICVYDNKIIYKDCWLKYFKELQKAKGDVKNEN